jgi:hypothetical protein
MEFQISNFKKSIIESVINDNRDFIINNLDGSIADYLIGDLKMSDTGYTDFLTDEQIEYYEVLSGEEKSIYFNEIIEFIKSEYNYKLTN